MNNFSKMELDKLEASGRPAFNLLHILAEQQNYTVEKLFKHLIDMERMDITKGINDWIDAQ